MRYEDLRIPLSAGTALAANVYRPDDAGRYPVLLVQSPYGKDVHFSSFNPKAWESLTKRHPEAVPPGAGAHMLWEAPDPEYWVPAGYAVVHIDARGSGKTPGTLDVWSPQEIDDLCEAIAWAGAQPWSTGKVGMLGISYYAITQWLAASRRPPALAAIVPWEGASDMYRDLGYHGGIMSNGFAAYWWRDIVLRNQHGNPANPLLDKDSGERLGAAGPTLTAEELAKQRVEFPAALTTHPYDDEWHRARSADFARIDVPLLAAANFGGLGLHLRGTIEGYARAASKQKWLEIHTGSHFDTFSLPAGRALQRRFLDHFLKGEANGWETEPAVRLAVRTPDGEYPLTAGAWPLPQTRWTRWHLDASARRLATTEPDAAAQASFEADGEGLRFTTGPLTQAITLAGPVALKLALSSSTEDADLFAVLQAFRPDGSEITFFGANDPAAPLSQGWLRASHRRLDPARSTEYQPVHPHTHAAVEPLTAGAIVTLDIELWPTSLHLPAGHSLTLTLRGKDFARAEPSAPGLPFRGAGPFAHTGPDREHARFHGATTVYSDAGRDTYLLLPIIE